LEVLFPEKRCRESKSQAHFGSTVPGKTRA